MTFKSYKEIIMMIIIIVIIIIIIIIIKILIEYRQAYFTKN